MSTSPTPTGVLVYAGPASAWRGAEAPLAVDFPPDGWDPEGRESMLRWACQAGFPGADQDPWSLPDRLAAAHQDDPAGLAHAISDLVRHLGLDVGPARRRGWRWGPEGLWHDEWPRMLATWRWFANRLLAELGQRRVQAELDAAADVRRRAALAAYERSRAVEPATGSALSRAERRFVVDYFLLATGRVAQRVALTPTERAVREAVGQRGYAGDGWAWDTIRRRAVGVDVTETPDGHAGVIPWREALDQALITTGAAARQETLF